ncbi:MAG TPA: hypothetical protein DCL61_31105 [Cyanobacteria bacterium UBA12227]|nr:hypothetical protein [Cyanobacteria bacterium UBA12227]
MVSFIAHLTGGGLKQIMYQLVDNSTQIPNTSGTSKKFPGRSIFFAVADNYALARAKAKTLVPADNHSFSA